MGNTHLVYVYHMDQLWKKYPKKNLIEPSVEKQCYFEILLADLEEEKTSHISYRKD